MSAGARYGGHFVQGHVDFVCKIVAAEPDGTSVRYTFSIPEHARKEYSTGLLPKGYVALDGTSLTLTKVDDKKGEFGIMLIEHSQKLVVLANKGVGDSVNVEIDTVAKGITKIVTSVLEGNDSPIHATVEAIVRKVLAEKGL